jgi:chemotaxis signal transduction protein
VTPLHLLVAIGDERYAVPIQEVREVAAVGELTPVPGAPRAVMGVQNLRGQVITVVDLGAVLGTSTPVARRALVVVEDGGDPVALAVDTVVDVGAVDAQPGEDVEAPLAGSAVVDGRLVGILDVRHALRLAGGAA